MPSHLSQAIACGLLLGGLAACSSRSAIAPSPTTSLVAIAPAGGANGVDPHGSIVLGFDHPMASGMEMYVSLHEGDVTGAKVPCTASWSPDRTMLTLTPSAPLSPGMAYTLHLGGGMMDQHGDPVDIGRGRQMGGQLATGQMMTGSMMGGGQGGPMSGQEMGPGWMDSTGTYGIVFTFTTD